MGQINICQKGNSFQKSLFVFKNYDRKKRGSKPGTEKKDKVKDSGPHILCASCLSVITSPDERISMNEKHRHVFFNPAGIIYEIGCFREAGGCMEEGAYEKTFSWFPGFLWKIAICKRCMTHIGWHFSGKGTAFYGLIRNRLLEPL